MKKFLKITFTLLITIILLLGFTLPLNPPNGNWQQQFLPDIGGRNITDVFFLDSITGWAVTNARNQTNDTIYVLQTINGGGSWSILFAKFQTGGGFPGYFKISFLNELTGYTCSVSGIDKTTDGGINWNSLNAPLNSYQDLGIRNSDTLWIVSSNILSGGVFRTIDGGLNWEQQFSQFGLNPDHIYMYNSRIGFAGQFSAAPRLFKTTNSGVNWFSLNDTGFTDMYFADSLTGWMSMGFMKKTTNGGLNWSRQILPTGTNITNDITTFSNINRDTIWAGGGYKFYPGSGNRGILNFTTNGGETWYFQIPDTSFHIAKFPLIQFVNKRNGWAYNITQQGGIHTTNGGDTTFILGINEVQNIIPEKSRLFQNYPNPFNPVTTIKYSLPKNSSVVIKIYDLLGREVAILVNQFQTAGYYDAKFDGTEFASGVYFYRIEAGDFVQSRKMVLVK